MGREISKVAPIEPERIVRQVLTRREERHSHAGYPLTIGNCAIRSRYAATGSGTDVKVATSGHLIAAKVLSHDGWRRPRDKHDLVQAAASSERRERSERSEGRW